MTRLSIWLQPFTSGLRLAACRDIEALVRKLLDAGGQGPQVAEWEQELNALVYEVCGLTEEEMAIVEGRLNHE